MTTKLINKIITRRIYDTRRYRYIIRDNLIQRLPIAALGTTAAIDGWETIYTL